MIRSLKGLDKMFYQGKTMTPIVLRFENPKDVAPNAEKLAQKVLAFQLGANGHTLYANKQHVPIYDLPNISNDENLSYFMVHKHTRPFDHALGSIGVNKDSIVLNCNQMVADHGYLHFIIDEISNNRDSPLEDVFPYSVEYLFDKEINEAPNFKYNIKKMTRFISEDRDQFDSNQYAQFIISKMPASSLKCYDKDKKSVKELTETLITNFYASIVAFNSQSFNCGVESCVDLRKYLKKQSWNITRAFSIIPVVTNVVPNETLHEIKEKIKYDIYQQFDNGSVFSYLKNIFEEKNNFKRSNCEISNLGKTHIGGPLADVFYGFSELSKTMKQIISITAYNIIGNGKNDVTFRLKYNSSKISEREAKMMLKSTIWSMQNIDSSFHLEKAIDEIQQFQIKYLKENKGIVKRYFDIPENQ